MRVIKVISGGQTGADRTFLEVACEFGIPTGGHCPLGCRTDVGYDLDLRKVYGLQETISSSYVPRTILNTQNSDGTVWFGSVSSPGYKCTRRGVMEKKRNLRLMLSNPTVDELIEWVERFDIKVMNGAGNRQSTNPGIIKVVRDTLTGFFERQGLKKVVIGPDLVGPVEVRSWPSRIDVPIDIEALLPREK